MMSLCEIISFSDSCIFTGRSLLYPQITGSHLPRHSLRWTYDRVKALAKTWQRTLMIPISYSKPRSVFLLLLWSFLICDYVQVFLKGKKWWIWGKESRKNVYPSMNCVFRRNLLTAYRRKWTSWRKRGKSWHRNWTRQKHWGKRYWALIGPDLVSEYQTCCFEFFC